MPKSSMYQSASYPYMPAEHHTGIYKDTNTRNQLQLPRGHLGLRSVRLRPAICSNLVKITRGRMRKGRSVTHSVWGVVSPVGWEKMTLVSVAFRMSLHSPPTTTSALSHIIKTQRGNRGWSTRDRWRPEWRRQSCSGSARLRDLMGESFH